MKCLFRHDWVNHRTAKGIIWNKADGWDLAATSYTLWIMVFVVLGSLAVSLPIAYFTQKYGVIGVALGVSLFVDFIVWIATEGVHLNFSDRSCTKCNKLEFNCTKLEMDFQKAKAARESKEQKLNDSYQKNLEMFKKANG